MADEKKEQSAMDLDGDTTVNKSMKTQREICPKGNFQAVISFSVPAGTHKEHFPPKPAVMVKKHLVIFEVNKRNAKGTRFGFNRKWSVSMDAKANMRKDLDGMNKDTDNDFKLSALKGENFMANVYHEVGADKSTYAKVGTFASLPEGMPSITPEALELPDWAKIYISESVEYQQKWAKEIAGGLPHPYADAIKAAAVRKAQYANGGNANANQAAGGAPGAEDDLPF